MFFWFNKIVYHTNIFLQNDILVLLAFTPHSHGTLGGNGVEGCVVGYSIRAYSKLFYKYWQVGIGFEIGEAVLKSVQLRITGARCVILWCCRTLWLMCRI